ncbi:DUF1987 domain-containing protein [Magnetospira sp. QH-2]|uniref:DUF1987 domain-containing protein n=1 Tax=Magnetospira sp. (strain QH-2) TaxID=1288970 RepID=UPI0003E8119F|nr:DUF1987 domain-containing protein [Magnetospira sp. QH-2]CCQ74848.1 conserved protein of unknown function [Magnetospira sp. QH-2]
MENIKIEATDRSPEIDFDFANNKFNLRGESYPEDVTAFYGPVVAKLEEHLGNQDGAAIAFNFELIYFNSSSAKILMGLFDLLDDTADDGNEVTITWAYEEEDDNMQELGEEFGEDLENAKFVLKEIAT